MKRGLGTAELVVLAGLLLIFLAGFVGEGEKKVSKGEILLASENIGMLGSNIGGVKRMEISGRFSISKGTGSVSIVSEEGPIEVAKGFLTTKEHIISFQTGRSQEAELEFTVEDSNYYGELEVYLNNELIWHGMPEKGEKVSILLEKEKIRASNELRISAQSSGWRIWAPTYYILKDLKVSEKVEEKEAKELIFYLDSKDLSNLNLARLVLRVSEGTGDVRMLLNNHLIYSGSLSEELSLIDFSPAFLEEGNNSLRLEMASNGFYTVEYAKLLLFYGGNQTSIKVIKVEIPESDYIKLKQGIYKGVIEVEVNKVLREGKLKISVITDTERVLYNREASKGKLVFYFTGDEVSPEFKLSISSEGTYEIGEVVVKLVSQK